MEWLTSHWIEIIAVLGGITSTASIVVKWTPTQADDKFLAKVVRFLNVVAINPKR